MSLTSQTTACKLVTKLLTTLNFRVGCRYSWIDLLLTVRATKFARKEGLRLTSGPLEIGYPYFCCVSGAHTPCHGYPTSDRKVLKNDLVKVDLCLSLNGWFADACRTYLFGKQYRTLYIRVKEILTGTLEVLDQSGWRAAIQFMLGQFKRHHLAVVIEYGGHYIGKKMHEDFVEYYPDFNLVDGRPFTFEPIVTYEGYTLTKLDRWTHLCSYPCVMFEDTVVVSKGRLCRLTEVLGSSS